MPKFYGCLPKKSHDGPLLSKYLLASAAALAIPAAISWYQNLSADSLQMYGNDRAGCCTFAAVGNQIICWSINAGHAMTPNPALIMQGYEQATGYDPQTGANDTGCAETDVLSIWQTNGIAGNKAAAWTEVDAQNPDHLKLGCWYFGGVYLGLTVTAEAEQQTDAGQPWQLGWFNSRVGRHAVPMLGYDANYLYVGTWGKVQPIAWNYWQRFGDEAYVVVDSVFLAGTGVSPVGLNLDQMIADQAQVAA